MRRHVIPASLTAAAVALATATSLLAAEKPKIPGAVKSKVAKAVEELVNGDISPADTTKREQIFVEIDKLLSKDKDDAALKTPEFWVQSMQEGFFAGKSRKQGKTKSIEEMKLGVRYADESVGEVPVYFRGPNAYMNKNVHTVVVTVLPKGADVKAWLQSNWEANETAKNGWVLGAVAISDKFPLKDQPFLLAHVFSELMFTYNTNPNKWYLEAVGDACEPVQMAACETLADRLAGVILRNPAKAVTNVNTKLYSTYVLDEGAAAEVGKAYTELAGDHAVVAAAGETANDDLAAWIEGHAGRAMPSSYEWVTTTNEKRIVAPLSGSVYLESPAKRGETITFKVTYDMEANSVDLTGTNLGEFVLYMNDDLVDLDKPVMITCNGSELVTKQFERNLKGMFDNAEIFGEFGRVFTAEFRGFAPTEVAADAGGGDAAGDGGDAKKDGE